MPKQKSSQKYWEKRRELEDKARLKMEDQTRRNIIDIFPEALKRIQENLLSQGDLHNMTGAEVLQDYSKRDQEKYRKYIEDNYQELMNSDDKYKEFIDEYFPSYDYAKVNRLLQIRSDIFSILASETIKMDANKLFSDRLGDLVNRYYNSNASALSRILSDGNFSTLKRLELDNILNYPWSGKTFSNRLWGNISKLEERLSNSIVTAMASGEGVIEALRTMRNDPDICDMFKLEKDKFDRAIKNLVRTEYSHFAVEGIDRSFKETGIKVGISWSAEDERVCRICGTPNGMHGKEIKEDEPGPPYHGGCRCTKIPKLPDLDSKAIDKLYDEMFSDLLDEFANNQFGVVLKSKNKTDEESFQYQLMKQSYKDSKQDRVKLAKSLLSQAGVYIDVELEDTSGTRGYNQFADFGKGKNAKVIKFVLQKNDDRELEYQLKTVFHEIYHSRLNGLEVPTSLNGKFTLKEWIDIEETMTELAAHYQMSMMGEEMLMPAYPKYLAANLPRLKQLDEFSDCNSFLEFGERAMEYRFNPQKMTADWRDLYKRVHEKSFDISTYTKDNYSREVVEYRSEIKDLIKGNSPTFDDFTLDYYYDEFISGLDNGGKLDNGAEMVGQMVLTALYRLVGVR